MNLTTILWFALACGTGDDLARENERLKVRVADLERANTRLEEEADQCGERLEQLDRELRRFRNRAVYEDLGIEPGQDLHAVIHTGMGDIHCELWPQVAPRTVLNFVQLAEGTRAWEDPRTGEKVERPLYDGTTFHRVIPGFMIQGGDPLGTGSGGPGYRFADEIVEDVTFDRKGLLAMANAGPDTNGSQFFVTTGVPTHLNGRHTIFGTCAEDLPVVEAISRVKRNERDKPLDDVVIERIEIQRD